MQKISEVKLPDYTRTEELLNVLTHAAGAVFGIWVLIRLLLDTVGKQSPLTVFACVVYALSTIAVFTVSSIYHAARPGQAKRALRILDHCTIYLVIAGSYTPAVLCKAYYYIPKTCIAVFILLWAAAILGVILNIIDLKKHIKASMVLYLLCGWSFVFAMPQLFSILGWRGLIDYLGGGMGCLLLGIGAAAYTIGALIYALVKKKYMHTVYHVFIDIGTVFLFIFLYNTVIPV